jgi:hypothetical protein
MAIIFERSSQIPLHRALSKCHDWPEYDSGNRHPARQDQAPAAFALGMMIPGNVEIRQCEEKIPGSQKK